MPPKSKYTEGEKVLCFHGNLIYEAKCLKLQTKDKVVKYFVHYAGWNKSWDEWVPESRILKYTVANLQRQKNLKSSSETKIKVSKTKTTPKSGKSTTPSGPSTSGKRKDDSFGTTKDVEKVETIKENKLTLKLPKSSPSSYAGSITSTPDESKESSIPRKRARTDVTVEPEEEAVPKVKIFIPMALKQFLVDDWDLVTRRQKLYNLPAQCNIKTILQEYVKYKCGNSSNNASKQSSIVEVTKGICDYFKVTLGTQLLYNYERNQYSDLLEKHPGKPLTELYGSIHLLRLFVKLGGLLAYTPLDEYSAQLLTSQLKDFLTYLKRNFTKYFREEDYHPVVKTD